ncbi:MAG TPA: hypothetical protein VGM06_07095 [Polyangiaceae bacterium]
MNAALARAPWARVSRGTRSRIAVIAWCLAALAFAAAARARHFPHAADRVLLDACGPLVLPLLSYALAGAVVGGRSFSSAVAPLKAFGASPARAAVAALAVAIACCASLGALLGAAADVISQGTAVHSLALRDGAASAYACALGGAAYAAWFVLGATFGRRGGGRLAFLLADWVLGANVTAAALVTPRGHLRNILGGAPPMELSERGSAIALVAIALLCSAIATWRVRR